MHKCMTAKLYYYTTEKEYNAHLDRWITDDSHFIRSLF